MGSHSRSGREAANLVCFFLMRHDKRCAAAGKRRIPERTLFLSAALFGALGGVAAMKFYRHKTRHLQFRIFFPLLLIIQIILAVLICRERLL